MMSRQKYVEIIKWKDAYDSGVRTPRAISAHMIYSDWQKKRLVRYMRDKYAPAKIDAQEMSEEKYAEIMKLSSDYRRGIRNKDTRYGHSIYVSWQTAGLTAEYRQKYAKLSTTVKLHEINKILVSCLPDEEKVKEISEIMKR